MMNQRQKPQAVSVRDAEDCSPSSPPSISVPLFSSTGAYQFLHSWTSFLFLPRLLLQTPPQDRGAALLCCRPAGARQSARLQAAPSTAPLSSEAGPDGSGKRPPSSARLSNDAGPDDSGKRPPRSAPLSSDAGPADSGKRTRTLAAASRAGAG